MCQLTAPFEDEQAFFDFLDDGTIFFLHGLNLERLELSFPIQAFELISLKYVLKLDKLRNSILHLLEVFGLIYLSLLGSLFNLFKDVAHVLSGDFEQLLHLFRRFQLNLFFYVFAFEKL